MEIFDPIQASEHIKESFIDYITTSFRMADDTYADLLRQELKREGCTARGPYLDVSGSYKTGASLEELMKTGEVSPLFAKLEQIPEQERELKLQRPLYLHQETALKKANAGKNLVVTTGTGSGKTECFLIPVLNALLREQEQGTLQKDAVRAIIIYPMNALANDQMKRMRALLKQYPDITFGLYNGNTRHTEQDALRDYQIANGKGAKPFENELISRERMQKTPPHILITNYSMLEYMMLRPKDDAVFSGAKLRYIILDEAHIYKGTTGMETAMLMRRLRARISTRDTVQYILTSATLGGKDADAEITNFAQTLCEVAFDPSDIVRSESALPPMKGMENFPPEMFTQIARREKSVSEVLCAFSVTDYAPEGDYAEKCYELLLHSALFRKLILHTAEPITLEALCQQIPELTAEQLKDFIAVCTAAEKGHISLIKARYHFFVRATEGAYITLNAPQQLFMQRKTQCTHPDGTVQTVFEIAVCLDCGRIALVGAVDRDGYLKQVSRKNEYDPDACEYYLVVDAQMRSLGDDEPEDEDDDEALGEAYSVCACCGKMGTKADLRFGNFCACEKPEYITLKKVRRTKSGAARCPACENGSLRAFYLGGNASTAVLGTELFELLPDVEVLPQPEVLPKAPPPAARLGVFMPKKILPKTITKPQTKQFLCFSDSRSEAAFFANYMEKSYQEFLRRRGILQVAESLRTQGETKISVPAFVKRLIRFFDEKKTFQIWNPDQRADAGDLHVESERNAWIAILNEMFNARRGTSLMALGRLSFEYQPNQDFISSVAEVYQITERESRDLLDQLAMDAVFTGAINAGSYLTLNDAERDYIFFSPYEKRLVLQKKEGMHSALSGWAGRKQSNNTYFRNTRLDRLKHTLGISAEDADAFLVEYWNGVFQQDDSENTEYMLNAADFHIRFLGDSELQFYRCKKCGTVTPYHVKGCCASVYCTGKIEPIDPEEVFRDNRYLKLYQSTKMEALQIKEHTAQLSKNHQTRYQQAFVNKEIHALSCSTTFEMGVDVGSLETVYMRNIPPSPANYVQRAGRAGRSKRSAAYVLTYAKLSSHDMTFYSDPKTIISGSIQAPVFSIQNEKVVNRHIYAVALSKFFAAHEEVYDGDDQSALLNEGGYEKLKEYLASKPKDLKHLLMMSVPQELHIPLGITDYSWTESLIGEDGVLEIAVREFREEVAALEKAMKKADKEKERERAAQLERELRAFRCGKEDGRNKKRLIDFFVRNNVLPKYGFPVDTVELQPPGSFREDDRDTLQLARDLQLAIAEYAPGSEVIADGHMYTSRYIRRLPGKENSAAWEKGYYCECPSCQEPNFSKKSDTKRYGAKCISCQQQIPWRTWKPTLEPRRGFWTDGSKKEVPLKKPERDYKTADYYIGDMERRRLIKTCFTVNGQEIEMESTANDSLAVVGLTDYYVCEHCGYADDAEFGEHKTVRGFPCSNKKLTHNKYRLSHTFKTFVAKIKFCIPEAQDEKTMLSVMYALLEGLSRELSIERTDLKGCLHREALEGCQRPVFAVILYDAVAGGAGHVRRMVTDDAAVFQRVLDRAITVASGCTCDPSCYQCLRNYYNAQIHDLLDRNLAAAFLKQWVGTYIPKVSGMHSTAEADEPQNETEGLAVPQYKISLKNNGRNLRNYAAEQIWELVLNDCEEADLGTVGQIRQKHTGVGGDPVYQAYFTFPELSQTVKCNAALIWQKQKVIFFLSEQFEDYEFAKQSGWHCYCTAADPDLDEIIRLIGG